MMDLDRSSKFKNGPRLPRQGCAALTLSGFPLGAGPFGPALPKLTACKRVIGGLKAGESLQDWRSSLFLRGGVKASFQG